MKNEKSLQTSILNLTMHSQLIETNTNLQMDVLKQLDNNYENKTWQQETNDFQNKIRSQLIFDINSFIQSFELVMLKFWSFFPFLFYRFSPEFQTNFLCFTRA